MKICGGTWNLDSYLIIWVLVQTSKETFIVCTRRAWQSIRMALKKVGGDTQIGEKFLYFEVVWTQQRCDLRTHCSYTNSNPLENILSSNKKGQLLFRSKPINDFEKVPSTKIYFRKETRWFLVILLPSRFFVGVKFINQQSKNLYTREWFSKNINLVYYNISKIHILLYIYISILLINKFHTSKNIFFNLIIKIK